ncbi:MAG: DUF1631 domain-containing protein [Proteobacteria bacterium]|nr:DUF1631 domain-containing protein [Pseudomonadota bacterium]MBS0493313.1 DUF1631 domain-containing protein [Pseudomonadota bacterium]
MDNQPSSTADRRLAQLARQRFVENLCTGLAVLDKKLYEFLTDLMAQTATQRDMQLRRDAWLSYQAHRKAWVADVARSWREALVPQQTVSAIMPLDGDLQLLDDDTVENKLLASRMALTVTEHVGAAYEVARQRTQHLDGREISSRDILRPEALCLRLVESWLEAGLKREELQLVVDPVQASLGEQALAQYQALTKLYDEQGVVTAEQLRTRQLRAASPPVSSRSGALERDSAGAGLGRHTPFPATMMAPGGGMQVPMAGVRPGMAGFANPLAYARQRAQGVMMQLRRWLPQAPAGQGAVRARPPSSALMHALSDERIEADLYYSGMATLVEDYSPQAVVHVAQVVRERAAEFKKKASTADEKAIIEVVAMMFQSILNEDRIPPAVRVWFARLQVPVLRVALAEPEFFSDLTHPARQLIDRMGSCVLGFDASAINGTALETEVRRVVQVIEQYPETGKRVFELVLAEFEKFLAKYLTENKGTARIISVAQQVEQRETLAIQYTIELRNMLKGMPVRDEIRDFLFKSWAEVLAMAAVREGPHHAETAAYKRAAADLVWAASAKPNRADRARVIQQLPALLQRLRQGLALVGVTDGPQDAQIKTLTDTLAEAFLSKTASIPQEHIDTMAKRLAGLEDFISDDALGEIPLSAENIELLLGIDASSIRVVADNGSAVPEDMLAWAQQLPLGAWFTIDLNGAVARVQYAWHSQRKQLHLFAALDGSSYLLQLRAMASFMQAGLLVAQEEESLTLRATREALTRLDADPERLFQ